MRRGILRLKTLGKYYIVDIGIKNYFLGKINDSGRILENIVFLELLRRNYKVYIGKIDNIEVDFIAKKDNEIMYIQVSESIIAEETRNRELKPLQLIKDNYKKILLTMDENFLYDMGGIEHKNIIEWLVE